MVRTRAAAVAVKVTIKLVVGGGGGLRVNRGLGGGAFDGFVVVVEEEVVENRAEGEKRVAMGWWCVDYSGYGSFSLCFLTGLS